jgi:adenylate cyclase
MGMEIERKFLVRNDTWTKDVSRVSRIEQGYLSVDPARTVRVRVRDSVAEIGVKGASTGISRPEFEYGIPLEDARLMLDFCFGVVGKFRHEVEFAGHTWEIDVFEGMNAGLITAEIELGSEGETFERPAWLGAEISHKPMYFNSSLVRHPYSLWGLELNVIQGAHVAQTSPERRQAMSAYLRSSASVEIRASSAGQNGKPFVIRVAAMDFEIDSRPTEAEAYFRARELGLLVVRVTD